MLESGLRDRGWLSRSFDQSKGLNPSPVLFPGCMSCDFLALVGQLNFSTLQEIMLMLTSTVESIVIKSI